MIDRKVVCVLKYQFSSVVNVDLDAGGTISNTKFPLKPVVSIAVNGMSICHIPLFCNGV